MKRYHGKDFKRIGHTTRLARHAEQIGKEEQGNLAVILSAAYLHDIGNVPAEQERKNPEGKGREDGEAEKVVRALLAGAGAKEQLIDEVCSVLMNYRDPGRQASVDIKTVHDASIIARLEEEQKENPLEPEKLTPTVEQTLLMDSSRRLAKRVLLGAGEN